MFGHWGRVLFNAKCGGGEIRTMSFIISGDTHGLIDISKIVNFLMNMKVNIHRKIILLYVVM